MKKRINIVLFCAVSFMCASVGAAPITWHVSQQSGDDSAAAADDTGATAFLTIQAAIAKASAGDTIRIDPGTYTGPTTDNKYGVSRLYIDKALTIESTGTRDDTFIVGAWDVGADPTYGLGPNAIRCVCATATVTIKGFTFLNGATPTGSDSAITSGGGFYGGSSATTSKIVDCAFVNCSGTRGGGMRYGFAYRTLFRNCYASVYGAATREAKHSFCVIERCKGSRIVAYVGAVIHCTFVHNETTSDCIHASGANTVRNCVFASGSAKVTSNVTLEGCVSCAPSSEGTVSTTTRLNVFDGVVSPLFGDAHPVAGGVLDGTAADCSEYISNEFRDLDFEGHPVDWRAGKLCPGALQKTVTVASGKLQFANNTATLTVDGVSVGTTATSTNYTYATCWPTQYLVAATASNARNEILRLDMYSESGSSFSARRPPLTPGNTVWVTAPPAGTSIMYAPYQTDKIYWVSEGADAAAADGTAAHPYPNIQDAVSYNAGGINAGGNRIVKVTAGTYDQGVGERSSFGVQNRVELYNGGFLRLIGVDGAENTFIVGAADQNSADGCGPGAVRCVAVTNGNCVIQGFTLTGGHAGAGETPEVEIAQTRGGATISASEVTGIDKSSAFFVDCIISNNVARHSAVGYGGRFLRCLIADNRTVCEDAVLMGAVAANCLFLDNTAPAGDVRGNYGYSFNCTFVKRDEAYGPAYARGNVQNCVCYALSEPTVDPTSITGTVIDGFTAAGAEVTRADPLFRDRDGGDCRLATCSPAVGLGTPESQYWWQFAGADFNGNRYRFIDGKVISGAFQTLVPSVSLGVSAGPASGASVDGAAATGVVFFAENEGVTLTANDVATRLFDGFAINGEKVEGSEASATFTYNPAVIPVPGDTLTALYLTNWYVNATSGNDANSGASTALAKKTLAAALGHAVAGDVVHAAEGLYGDGSMLHTGYVYVKTPESSAPAPYIRSRAVVPEGVTLVADGARDGTVILGAADTTSASDGTGLGPNAVRCVMLETNAVIRGFTLRGGRTDFVNLEDDNNEAGGLLGRNSTSMADDCQFEDCRSVRGGAGRAVTFRRCRFIGNSGTGVGSIARECNLYGCYFAGNTGRDVVSFPYKVSGCTFAPGNVTSTGGVAPPIGSLATSSAGRKIINTLFCEGTAIVSDEFINCAMPSNATFSASGGKSCVFTDCVMADTQDLSQLDANGVPLPGLNPACDGGDLAEWTAYGLDAATDAAGNPRVANGAMDIGCYEADWKSRYSADIGRRGSFTVSAADPYAHEEESGEVRLTGGEIAGTLNVAGSCMFPVRITGNGTLTVTVDGVATAYAGPLASFPLAVAATDGAAMSFAYVPGEDDEGGAFIGLGGRLYGAALTIR